MKVRNIMFSGVMAAILMGSAGAHAAVEIASKQYVLNQVGDKATTEALNTAKNELQAAIDLKASQADLNTTNAEVAKKANSADVYTKTETNNLLDDKVDLTVYNQHLTDQIARDNAQDNAIDALVGSDGQGGSFAELTTKVETLTGAADVTGSVANQIASSLTDYAKTSYVDTQDEATLGSAKSYTDEKVGALTAADGAITALQTAVADKASQADLNTVSGRVDTAEGKITTAEGKISTLETTVAGKASQADLATVSGRVDTAEGKITAAEGKISTAEGKIEALENTTENLLSKPQTNTCSAASGLCVLTLSKDGSQLVWIDVTDPAQ